MLECDNTVCAKKDITEYITSISELPTEGSLPKLYSLVTNLFLFARKYKNEGLSYNFVQPDDFKLKIRYVLYEMNRVSCRFNWENTSKQYEGYLVLLDNFPVLVCEKTATSNAIEDLLDSIECWKEADEMAKNSTCIVS